MSYLPYISDENLKAAVSKVVSCIREKQGDTINLHKNVIDPFSAVFDGVVNGLSLQGWLEKEKARQTQKSVENKIGEFHEDILSSISGWEKVDQGIDIRNMQQQVIAEIKNKHNTIKGSDKVGTYDFLQKKLSESQYQGFTAYYVEILPSTKKSYNKPFTPSDRSLKTTRSPNEQIRQISGQAFYALATGHEKGLEMLFRVLPDVISEVAKINHFSELQKESFRELFDRAY